MVKRWSPATKQPSRLRTRLKVLLLISLLAGTAWGIGFAGYLNRLNDYLRPIPGSQFDAIVVLTGGAGRIQLGAELLNENPSKPLFISGVNNAFANQTILDTIEVSDALKDCCIILGRDALNTEGNASETIKWAEDNNMQRLLIITADYHMDRAISELRARNQTLDFLPLAVKTGTERSRLALEYSKYLISLLRINLL